jgi:hypothetical protein
MIGLGNRSCCRTNLADRAERRRAAAQLSMCQSRLDNRSASGVLTRQRASAGRLTAASAWV